MVRYLTLFASSISTISVLLISIFGIIPLMMGEISATQYYQMDQLRERVNVVSIELFIARIGIILIFTSTLFKTNIMMMFGSIGGILIFVWGGINDIYRRSLLFSTDFLSFMSSAIEIITVISVILFAIGSLLFYKESKMMVVAGTLLSIYVFFYIFFYSTVIDLIFGFVSSNEKRIFNLLFFFFEKILFIFAGWYISFSSKSESKKRIDLMETVFNFDSNIVN